MQNSLYSFVLVDDEPEIRDGIRDTIAWEEHGFRFAGAYANGSEALEAAERNPPDVLMTDINMPFMNGLALSERLASVAPATKVIIISGYDDFEYAQKALKLQVFDYVVKPITPGEFKAALARLKALLDGERMARQDQERIRNQLAESLPHIKERFLNKLITGKIKGAALAERVAYFSLSLPLAGAAYQCLAIDFARRRSGEEFDLELLSERNVLEAQPGERQNRILFQDAEDRLIALSWGAQPAALYREGLRSAEAIRRDLLNAGLGDTVIGVGEAVLELEGLSQSYGDALSALQIALLKGRTGVSAYRELGSSVGSDRAQRPLWGKAIASALKLSNIDECKRRLSDMAEYFKSRDFELPEYRDSLRLVLAGIVQSIDDLDIPARDIFPPGADPFAELLRLKSLEAVSAWLGGLLERVAAYAGARQESFAAAKVREALDYLEAHYGDPELSMQTLCKELYISTSYLSANLKRYNDRSFVEQLTEIRIGKAKELLRSTALKTYEIAEKVGYRDAHYFSLSFRKLANMTPTEYRSRHEPRQS
jgi:two-component system response regulator YesN